MLLYGFSLRVHGVNFIRLFSKVFRDIAKVFSDNSNGTNLFAIFDRVKNRLNARSRILGTAVTSFSTLTGMNFIQFHIKFPTITLSCVIILVEVVKT
jgi:hypothetical protein